MFAKIYSATLLGLECKPIEVEVDYRPGLSSFTIVGLGDKAIQESKERISTALKNAQIGYIPRRTTINLAPANLTKAGSNFDLAIAVGMLVAMGKFSLENLDKTAFLGELALDGQTRPILGVLPLAYGLQQLGFKRIVIPAQNLNEVSMLKKIDFIPLQHIKEILEHDLEELSSRSLSLFASLNLSTKVSVSVTQDMADIKGQTHAKRALQLAAITGSNVLLSGAPGVGKTMLAKALVGIMPQLDEQQKFETTNIYSVIGEETDFLPESRPFRAPHHTTTRAALIGGGNVPTPGEITMAHNGVLFLDELPEFSRVTLDSLRQPLQDGKITISRANYKVHYPANFLLVGAMNLCNCGNRGGDGQECTCTNLQVQNYQKRISGPLLDRIPIHVSVSKIDYENVFEYKKAPSSTLLKSEVLAAREFYQNVYGESPETFHPQHTEKLIAQKFYEELRLLRIYTEKFKMSIRSYYSSLQLALGISALNGQLLNKQHVSESLTYRPTLL